VWEALLKHVREAGLYTSWTEQEPAYEETVEAFVASGPCGPQGERVTGLRSRLEPHIRANVLGAALVQLTMPGVPDVYQGTEAEYLALVDPDNRRPVRFPPQDAGDKGAVTAAALRLRRRRPEVFGDGAAYVPLAAEGSAAAHCTAFTRSGEVVTAVTRLSLRLAEAGGWRDTVLPLPPGVWADVLTPGREFSGHARVEELFGELPVALLERVGDTAD
jgi:(1->4)-alpha-D-glucan 1-alpha-D-glucosylmutase